MDINRANANFITPEERQLVLRTLNLTDAPLLGVGTEAEVYARDDNTVLKLYADTNRLPYFETLKHFYANLDTRQSGLSFPSIHEITCYGDIIALIESRIHGFPLQELLQYPDHVDHNRAEELYLDTLWKLKQVQITLHPKTYLLFDEDGISDTSTQSFNHFYSHLLERKIQHVGQFFASSFSPFPAKARALVKAIRDGQTANLALVHGDFYPGNVLVNRTLTRTHGIIDFGSFTVFGNYLLDIAGAFGFYRMYDPDRASIRQRLLAKILLRLQSEEHPLFFQYLLANAIITSDLYATDSDPRTDDHFRWATEFVANDSYWQHAL